MFARDTERHDEVPRASYSKKPGLYACLGSHGMFSSLEARLSELCEPSPRYHYGLRLKHRSGDMPTLTQVDNEWSVFASFEFKDGADSKVFVVRRVASFSEDSLLSLFFRRDVSVLTFVILAAIAEICVGDIA